MARISKARSVGSALVTILQKSTIVTLPSSPKREDDKVTVGIAFEFERTNQHILQLDVVVEDVSGVEILVSDDDLFLLLWVDVRVCFMPANRVGKFHGQR